MPDQSVIIEISPSKLELALVRDRAVVGSRLHHHDTASWEKGWPGVLSELGPTLARMVADLGCANARATVLYAAPGSVATISSCPLSTSAQDARHAAEMAITGLAAFSIDRNLFEVCAIVRDAADSDSPESDGAGGANESGTPSLHSLAIADSDDRAAAIAEWVDAAGLRLEGIAPVESVILRNSVRLCVDEHAPGEVPAVLWIGQHSSVLAVGGPGRLSFVRGIAAGTDSLIDAIARPLRARNSEAPQVSLDRNSLRSILATVGIPTTNAEIPGWEDLTGASLVPLLQPVIQRLALETKQSVRFGVDEDRRPRVRLYLAGSGATVANLGQAISSQSGFLLGPVPTSHPSAEPRGTRPVINAFLSDMDSIPLLLPRAHQQERTALRVRRALWGGVAVAGALIAFDSVVTRAELRAQNQTLTALRSHGAADAELVQSQARTLGVRRELIATEQRIQTALGQTPEWAAVVRAVGRATPPEIRVTTIDLRNTPDGARCQVRASLRTDSGQNTAAIIKNYLDQLGTTPLIESVKLGACQRGVIDGHEAQSFDLTLSAVSLPTLAHPGNGWDELASAHDSPEGTP